MKEQLLELLRKHLEIWIESGRREDEYGFISVGSKVEVRWVDEENGIDEVLCRGEG